MRNLLRRPGGGGVPWTFDFGSCKGINAELLEPARQHLGVRGSFAETFDYDIWIALDPDRVHHDLLAHVDDALRARVPATGSSACRRCAGRRGTTT